MKEREKLEGGSPFDFLLGNGGDKNSFKNFVVPGELWNIKLVAVVLVFQNSHSSKYNKVIKIL